MARTALVSGTAGQAADVARALEGHGYEVRVVEDPQALAAQGPPAPRLDAYVQLPVHPVPAEGNAVERVKSFLFHGLLARFDAVSAVLPALAPGARVVLVGGNQPGEQVPDDRQARRGLLHVLGTAAGRERQADGVAVAVVDQEADAEEIARVAAGKGTRAADLAIEELSPESDYADWRLEVWSRLGRGGLGPGGEG